MRKLLTLLLLLAVPAHAQNSTLANLPAASALSGSEVMYGVQAAGDVKISSAQLLTFILSGGVNNPSFNVETNKGMQQTGSTQGASINNNVMDVGWTTNAIMGFGSGNLLCWSSTTPYPQSPVSGSCDTTLSRVSAGVFQLGTTAGNALGSLNLTNLTFSGTLTSGSTAGVSCGASTVNLTTFVVTNGIVTHC